MLNVNKLKILLCCSSAPHFGLLKHMTIWACSMKKMGLNITVVSGPNEQEKGLFDTLKTEGVPFFVIKNLDDKFPYRLYRTVPEKKKILELIKPDVIHVMGIGHGVDFYLSSRRLSPNPKLICTLASCRHGTFYESFAYRVGASLVNWMFDYLVVISELDRNKMLKARTMPKKLKYIPNFVDINVFFEKNNLFKDSVEIHKYLKNGKPKIIYLAQLIKRKGHIYLFKALKIIRSKYPDVVLLLCGMGEYEKELRKEVKKMELNDSVHFLGQVPHDYIPAILSHCDISVVSSLSETFGWAIVEPLLAGTPVVSTRVGIAPEIEKAGGLLGVPVADSESLAKATLRLLGDHSLRKDTVERGVDYVKRYLDIHTVTMKYQELYHS